MGTMDYNYSHDMAALIIQDGFTPCLTLVPLDPASRWWNASAVLWLSA